MLDFCSWSLLTLFHFGREWQIWVQKSVSERISIMCNVPEWGMRNVIFEELKENFNQWNIEQGENVGLKWSLGSIPDYSQQILHLRKWEMYKIEIMEIFIKYFVKIYKNENSITLGVNVEMWIFTWKALRTWLKQSKYLININLSTNKWKGL